MIKLLSDQGRIFGRQGDILDEPWLREFLEGGKEVDRSEVESGGYYWQIDLARVVDGVVVVATNITSRVVESQEKDSLARKILKHDAATKIFALQFYLSQITESHDVPGTVAKALNSLQGLSDLLGNSAYLYGANRTEKREIVFKYLVEQALGDFQPTIDKLGAKVNIYGNGTIAWCDRTRMIQAISNICSNALKYQPKNPEHQPRIDIDIKPVSEGGKDYVRLTITDNGIGIDRGHLQTIFSPFHRLHSDEDYSGTGLGLAIVNQVVKEHGGTAGIESNLESGSIVWLQIPAKEDYFVG